MPSNIFIGGNNNPFLAQNTASEIANQKTALQQRLQQLEALEQSTQQPEQQQSNVPLFDELDSLQNELSEMQLNALQSDPEFKELNDQLGVMLQAGIILLAKPIVEGSENGNKLLKELTKLVKSKKSAIIQQTNRDMEVFAQFQEYTAKHPEATYSDFLQTLKK